jgi:aminoglycoside 6'-N-acetyltransferase I
MNVTIRSVRPEDRSEWLRMRRALWDDCPDEQQVRGMGCGDCDW